MEASGGDCPPSSPSLLCSEVVSFLDQQEDREEQQDREEQNREELLPLSEADLLETEDEYIKMLLSVEESLKMEEGSPTDKWLKSDRSDAVEWILEMAKTFRVGVQTLHLSVTYLDRYLSQILYEEMTRSWDTALLSVACVSLAAKMQEIDPPKFWDFRMRGFQFNNNEIMGTELLVLDEFKWRMSCVTPFLYLNFFASKFSNESDVKISIMSRATEHILAMMEVDCVLNHRPSVIAAAAVLAAWDQAPTKELMEFKITEMSSCGSLSDEHVFSCYNLMRKLEDGKLKMGKREISRDSQSTSTSSIDVLDDDFFNSTGSKRRKLT